MTSGNGSGKGHTGNTCDDGQVFRKRNSSAIGRRGWDVVSMPAFQAFTMISQGGKRVKGYGLYEGRIINGQKMFVLVIAGTAGFTVVTGMYQFFGHLAAEQPGDSLFKG
ncbi:MAG TPA: hypothetical protein VK563_08750 [Puia sp.]|nr:hypothetical protein [Puia sp.]